MADDPKHVLDLALNGHNVLILGQSGTGKSYLLKVLKKEFVELGKSVAVTGSTGVASLNILGITIHSWSGIGDGHFSNEELVSRIKSNEHYTVYKNNIAKTDILIIDEISMISCKLFNQLEYICRKVRDIDLYFGGIQVIGSGDFLQLPPVSDPLRFDTGEFCFRSKLFSRVFMHKVVLSKVMRQDEPDFVKAVNDVSMGNLPQETFDLLRRLQRPLPPGEEPTRLFATNFEKDVYNASRLIDLNGSVKTYDAIDNGDIKLLHKMQVQKTLSLKKGCPVMLVKNLNKNLVNGLQGTVLDLKQDAVTVKFENITTEIKKEMFTVFSCASNRIVASRLQIPLVLSFGITIHKSQGLTLDRVEVHCDGIFKAGMLGVAIGRARKKLGLRLVNFKSTCVLKPEKEVSEFYLEPSVPHTDKLNIVDCCKLPISLEQALLESFEDKDEDDTMSEISDFDINSLEEIDNMIEKNTLNEENDTDSEEEDHVNIDCPITATDLKSCLPNSLETPVQKALKSSLDMLMDKNKHRTDIFLKQLFDKILDIFKRNCHSGTNKQDDIGSKQWTSYYTELFKFSSSQHYVNMIQDCIRKKAEAEDFECFGRLFDLVSQKVLAQKASELKDPPIKVTSYKSDSAGLGKLRYICGCCVAKSKFHFMKLGKNNIGKEKKWGVVSSSYFKVKILDHFTATFDNLLHSTKYKETLYETERKQNTSQSLTNVKDSVFEFFIELDKCRCQFQNESALHVHGSNIMNIVLEQLLNSEDLLAKFNSLLIDFNFDSSFMRVDRDFAEICIKELFSDLLWRFCRISNDQFRKDMLEIFRKEKSDSLRKQVIGKPKKDVKLISKLSMSSIISDSSDDKKSSHFKLQSAVFDAGESVLKTFTKKELLLLCKAYNLNPPTKTVKDKLCDILSQEILKFQSIPNVRAFATQSDSIQTQKEPESSQSTARKATKRKGKTKFSKRKAKKAKIHDEKNDDEKCASCGRLYNEEHEKDWVQCNICDMWYDRFCQNIDEETFKAIEEFDWYCNKCCE